MSRVPIGVVPLLAVVALGAFLARRGGAQPPSYAVLPPMAATEPTRVWQPGLFHAQPCHAQVLYDAAQLPVASALLQAIAVRASNEVFSGSPSTRVTLQVVLAEGALPYQATSVTFASNVGANATTVFSGFVDLPGRLSSQSQHPWDEAIVFTQPYAFTRAAAPTLVVDVYCNTNSAGKTWFVEHYQYAPGDTQVVALPSGCYTSTGGTAGVGWGASQPYPGGPWTLQYSGLPANVPTWGSSLLFLGFAGPGTPWAGRTLPFDLTLLGLPGPDGCPWQIVPALSVPLVYVPGTQTNGGRLTLPPNTVVPDAPPLYGMRFFAQALGVDRHPVLGTPALVPLPAVQCTMGSGEKVHGAVVVRYMDTVPPQATGTRSTGEAPALRLRY